MDRILDRYGDYIYALTRIVVGFLFAAHGAQKIFGVLGGVMGSGEAAPLGLLWAAGIIELVGGLMVMLGLYATWAAFVCSGQMAVAYFLVHQPQGLLPIQNKGEVAVLYCWLFLMIAARGSGIWSIAPRSSSGGDSEG